MARVVGSRILAISMLSVALATSPQAQSPTWQRYVDPTYGYRIDLPMGMFDVSEQDPATLYLYEVDGLGQIDVYGAENAEGLTPQEFADELEQAERIEEVTYRTGGRRWFVLSGYYRREDYEDEDLIFYAKFMFSRDFSRLAAFEISYPLREKRRFNAIVDRLESSLRAPAAQ